MLDFEWGVYLAECINSNYFDTDLNQQICYSKNHELVLDVSRAISKLDSETSGFAFFDLGLSESDLKVLLTRSKQQLSATKLRQTLKLSFRSEKGTDCETHQQDSKTSGLRRNQRSGV